MAHAARRRDAASAAPPHGATVIGCGAQTPIGRSAPASMAAARAGIGRLREHPFIFNRDFEPVVMSRASWLNDDLFAPQRLLALAGDSLRETLAAAQSRVALRGARTCLFLAVPPDSRPGIDAAILRDLAAQATSMAAEVAGPVTAELIPGLHAAGLQALERASLGLSRGALDFAIVGGVDSYIAPETIRWLEAEGRLHGVGTTWGFAPGEAAGFLALIRRADARSIAGPMAQLGLARTTLEPSPMGSGRVCTGEGLTRAVAAALSDLPDGVLVDAMFCDLNGEPERADELGFTLARLSRRFRRPGDFFAPADRWGDVGAASAILLIIAAVAAWQRGYARGTNALVWSSSGTEPVRGAVMVHSPNPS
jgi:3-oxoacyl-[acyl-carrier-protein] synthase-1